MEFFHEKEDDLRNMDIYQYTSTTHTLQVAKLQDFVITISLLENAQVESECGGH